MLRTRALYLYSFFLVFCGPALAGPGHDHGDNGAPAATGSVAPRLESVGSTMELVATSDRHKLLLYLDHVQSNEPVESAEIEVSGDGVSARMAKQIAPGTFELEADWVDEPGTKALVFTVTSATEADLLNGTWTVVGPHNAAAETTGAPTLQQLLRRIDVLALIGGAFTLGFVIAFAMRARRQRSHDATTDELASGSSNPQVVPWRSAAEVALIGVLVSTVLLGSAMAGPGHDHGDGGHDAAAAAGGNTPRKLPDGSVFVPKPSQRLLHVRTEPATESTAASVRELIGTIIPDPASFGQVQAPMDGQIEVSTRGISYVGQNVQAGEVLALLAPSIPVADLGTMQQLRAEVEGKLIVAQQKLGRLKRIENVIARSQIDDTEAELTALREQKRVLEPKDTEKIQLRAPVSGIIAVANVRAGQVVSARDTLFEIVDPAKLWVEAITGDTHDFGDSTSATAVDSEGHTLPLEYVGRSPTLRQQSRPYLFSIVVSHPELAIGAPLKVQVRAAESTQGIIVPEAAVVRGSNGLPLVWVKESPERFRPAEVRATPLDNGRTQILAGLKPGDRVVVTAAELINQVR